MLFRDLTLHMIEGFDAIRPFDRVLVRSGHVPVAYLSNCDGSAAGYSKVGYILTKSRDGVVRSDILTAKRKVSKYTVAVFGA